MPLTRIQHTTRCERIDCDRRAARDLTVEHVGGEFEHMTLCKWHAERFYRDARSRLGTTVKMVEWSEYVEYTW